MKLLRFSLVGFFLLFVVACKSWFDDEEQSNPFVGVSAVDLFNQAEAALKKKEYTAAIKRFEALDTMYPFNDNAERASLDLVYAYYKKDEYPLAVASADRFIHLYPRAKQVDYAYYMKAMANFKQDRGGLANIVPIDTSWRDSGTQAEAYVDFEALVQKFPQSRYKANALQHMIYLRNKFAQHELNIAKFYYEHKTYVAAVERANYLIKTYPESPAVKEALVVLYYANRALRLDKAAAEAATVYQASYGLPLPETVPVSD